MSLLDGLADLIHIVTVDLLHEPAPSLIFLGSILTGHHLCLSRELDIVGIVEHDEVVETEVTGSTASTLRDLLLYATIRDVSVDGLVHHVAQTSLQELSGDGSTHSEAVTLTKRTGCVLDAALNLALGVTGSHRTPLTQVLQIFQRVLADEAELAVEHRSHVTWIEEETVATLPCGILGVIH